MRRLDGDGDDDVVVAGGDLVVRGHRPAATSALVAGTVTRVVVAAAGDLLVEITPR